MLGSVDSGPGKKFDLDKRSKSPSFSEIKRTINIKPNTDRDYAEYDEGQGSRSNEKPGKIQYDLERREDPIKASPVRVVAKERSRSPSRSSSESRDSKRGGSRSRSERSYSSRSRSRSHESRQSEGSDSEEERKIEKKKIEVWRFYSKTLMIAVAVFTNAFNPSSPFKNYFFCLEISILSRDIYVTALSMVPSCDCELNL